MKNYMSLMVRFAIAKTKTPKWCDELGLWDGPLQTAKVFEVEKSLCILLEKTDNVMRPIKLPFPSIFIDAELPFERDGTKLMAKGFLVREAEQISDEGNAIEVLFSYDIEKVGEILSQTPVEDGEFCVATLGNREYFLPKEERERFYLKDMIRCKETGVIFNADLRPFEEAVLKFVINFTDFLENPEVELVEVLRTQKTNEKRMKRGKIPLPPSTIVKINGKLKEYVDQVKKIGYREYSHQFWVRGHWRHLESEWYKEKRGVRIWVPPFIKGQGELIEKLYNLEGKKRDSDA